MYETILIIHVVLSAALIALVLLQQGKGAGMGALGGGGASQTLFGSQGSASFMSRTTAMVATGFFITSLSLSAIAVKQVKKAQAIDLPRVSQPAPTSTAQDDVPALPSEEEVPAVPE